MLKKLTELKGEERLERDIFLPNGLIILGEGTVLKKLYIEKLGEIGISEVHIVEESESKDIYDTLKEEHHAIVKNVFERHIYQHDTVLSELRETAEEIVEKILENEDVSHNLINIREKSTDVYEHSLNVCAYSTMIALRFGWNKHKIPDISTGALLHDIGLRYINADYMNEDIENRNDQIGKEYRKHPVYGYTAVEKYDWMSKTAKDIIFMHHCTLDRTGFPMMLKHLPKEVQIVAVSDLFDRKISGIGCKQMKVYEILEYIKVISGVKYDKEICDCFTSMVATYPNGTKVKLLTGETAMVIKQNGGFKERPVIRLICDKDGNNVKAEEIIDMMKNQSVFINEVLE